MLTVLLFQKQVNLSLASSKVQLFNVTVFLRKVHWF